MKPSKKQIKPNSKKTKVNLNETSVPLIPSFFKAAPKSFVVDKTNVLVNPKDGDRQFYVDLLKSKLESKLFVQYVFVGFQLSNVLKNFTHFRRSTSNIFLFYTKRLSRRRGSCKWNR